MVHVIVAKHRDLPITDLDNAYLHYLLYADMIFAFTMMCITLYINTSITECYKEKKVVQVPTLRTAIGFWHSSVSCSGVTTSEAP